uniref:Reverse transcriptase domain-containing protein n=1 Tax=Physcomitrium patens TaxID=3218 RepID=A0A7I4CEJ7_PHYPA
MISKGGATTNIRKYWTITTLSSTYRMAAKTLTNRLQSVLSSCIRPTQTGFVKDRYILDNTKESNQDLVIPLLDFEKAYDR